MLTVNLVKDVFCDVYCRVFVVFPFLLSVQTVLDRKKNGLEGGLPLSELEIHQRALETGCSPRCQSDKDVFLL